ncbi:MAG TPA: glycosyltransferase family 1 protein [Saprospiraceae bacterium]|nr:glycosyltransferase family 1 protein [Saprospiraceae bacterium]
MLKKIAIVELYGHYEVLYSFCNVLRLFEVSVFTSENGWGDAPTPIKSIIGKRVYLKTPLEFVPDFIEQHKSILNANDLIIFSTILGDYGFFAKQKWTAKTILVVHNGNYWLNYRSSIRIKSIPDILRWLKSEWLREWPNRKKIMNSVDFISFPNQLIQGHFIEQGLISREKTYPPLPFYYLENKVPETEAENEIIIVVPGTLSDESRDYGMLLNVFKKVKDIECGNEILNLVLLGLPKKKYGKDIQRKFKNMENGTFNVTVFSKFITQHIYDDWLKKADFLILPLLREMSYGICCEKGSVTKISGTINDMLRFGIPAFIPSYYTIAEKNQCLAMQFVNSEDLAGQITNCIKNKTYKEAKKKWKDKLSECSTVDLSKRVNAGIFEILY